VGRTKGVCTFCRRAGQLTEEDVLPLWIVKLMGFKEARFTNVITPTAGSAARARNWESVNNLGHKYRIVCGDCNRTWMSRMETRAKALIGALIFDPLARVQFTLDDQRFLAAWATKTHLVYRHGLPDLHKPSSATTHAFYLSRTPTPDTITLIARWIGAPTLAFGDIRTFRQRRLYAKDSADPGQDLTVEAVTFRIGHFVIQNVEFNPPQLGGVVAVDLRQDFLDVAFPVWPPRFPVLAWPPKVALNDRTFEALTATADAPWHNWPHTR
jgi:hypothetical protein